MSNYVEHQIRQIEGTNMHVRFYKVLPSSSYIVQIIFNIGNFDRRRKNIESRRVVHNSSNREIAFSAYLAVTATN